jgi:hypothetical protein
MVGQKGVIQTFILTGHDLVLFKFAGPFFLAGQLAPLGHGNVDGVFVIIINFSIEMVALATWCSITIAASAALIMAAPVAWISHIGCVAPKLALAWLGTSFHVPRILGTLLPGVPGWWSSRWQVKQARHATIMLAAGATIVIARV